MTTQPEEDVPDLDLYDSEILEINRVAEALNAHFGEHMELSAFQREARERFAEIGFVVEVPIKQSSGEDHKEWSDRVNYPEIVFVGRCEPQAVGEFDHERMGHEVRSNILGEKGRDSSQRTQVAPGYSATKSGIVVPD